MLRDFFSIPIHPDNEGYRRELFKDTKIMKEKPDLFNEYFCKYPVIFLSLKVCYLFSRLNCYCELFCWTVYYYVLQGYENCETWLKMQAKFRKKLAGLYKEYRYVYDRLDNYERSNFDQILNGVPKDEIMEDALVDLSRYLNNIHKNKCIVLIDEYDHPLDIAYRYQYYAEARGFFASLFGALFKVSFI